MWHSPIIRATTGPINKVNDAAPGGPALFGTTFQRYVGQLGQGLWLDDANILYDSSMGTVYGGHFRYVRLAAAAASVVVGQVVFWDVSVADNLYQVTTSESGGTDAAVFPAGIVLNSGWTAGNYSFIQNIGPTFVKFRAALTDAGAIGSPVYCAGVGGSDLGLADVLNDVNPATVGDVSLQQRRFLGVARQAPTNGGVKLVDLFMRDVRG